VVGGNVSLYNETDEGPIYPTPVVGMVGELPDPDRAGGLGLADGDAIAVCGPFAPSMAGSELAKQRGELGLGLPMLPIERVQAAVEFVRDAVRDGRVSAAHDVSDGGLACALAECAIAGGVGAAVDLDPLVEARSCSGETALFGEGPGGFVLAGPRAELEALAGDAGTAGVELLIVGEAGGSELTLSAAETELAVDLLAAERAWRSLGDRLEPA
jgi:phosphoribosylformylglycinamidine (FGAM) synthase-like enzyme